ncbi:hypothetical protein [Ferrimonas aestuarii]|uniref:Elp3/MiaA/NifB-like radical SAM core domain-containing protein n=1 Tax=Ferrimonas aestuarii TaxID=2569539 RepID=A0A4U1BP46_9GAMM|nr:hypothetical protein [Ferrimonas aestuarii]TKB56131.1 hypothetical protein FCL42_07910 [Ferrimonas aestuarii]
MLEIDGYACDQQRQVVANPVNGRTFIQQTVLLPGGGCTYYRVKSGDACTFCAFPGLTREVNKGAGFESYFESWRLDSAFYKTMFDSLTSDNSEVDRIAIFNGGSFFPNSELPSDFQRYVYQYVSKHENIDELLVEAYPRYISQAKLEEAIELIGDKKLLVGIGFESRNDIIRNRLLKKGIDRSYFERKIKMMQGLGIKSSVYVFLKAPGLTERQAYDEAINSIEYLIDLGVDEIALSCAFVQQGTALEAQYHCGEFRPPWLSTIWKIMEQGKLRGWPLFVGGFSDTPPPIAGPSNCSICDQPYLDAIERYRHTGIVRDELLPDCACQRQWETKMADRTPFQRLI